MNLSSTGFSLWGVGLARSKPHRLKPVLLEDHAPSLSGERRNQGGVSRDVAVHGL